MRFSTVTLLLAASVAARPQDPKNMTCPTEFIYSGAKLASCYDDKNFYNYRKDNISHCSDGWKAAGITLDRKGVCENSGRFYVLDTGELPNGCQKGHPFVISDDKAHLCLDKGDLYTPEGEIEYCAIGNLAPNMQGLNVCKAQHSRNLYDRYGNRFQKGCGNPERARPYLGRNEELVCQTAKYGDGFAAFTPPTSGPGSIKYPEEIRKGAFTRPRKTRY